MSDDGIPGIGITASGGKIELSLPPTDQSVVPVIPEGLRDREIPAFVVEWILESDEIATIVQELLQAPTRSLCREYKVPIPGSATAGTQIDPQFQLKRWQSPTPPILRLGTFDVMGFDDNASDIVPGLPAGVKLPARLLEIIAMARKVDAWLYKGQRVLEWSVEQGVPEASWMPSTDS